MAMKRGFSTIELLAGMFVMPFVAIASIAVISLMSRTLFFGQVESSDKLKMYDNINYISREIQSAQSIMISDKSMRIKQYGHSDYNLHYIISADNQFQLNGRKMFEIDYNESRFTINGRAVFIDLGGISFEVSPRSSETEVTLES